MKKKIIILELLYVGQRKKNKMITSILPNMTPMRDINLISEGDRLFYELGYKSGKNWIRMGMFKEVENISECIEKDKFINQIEYLDHHNFMLIKKG